MFLYLGQNRFLPLVSSFFFLACCLVLLLSRDCDDMSDPVLSKLEDRVERLQKSTLTKHVLELLDPINFTHVRCLALGSPATEFQALYQLALLKIVVENCHIDPKNVSFYDPAFTDGDIDLLRSLNFTVNELYDPLPLHCILYYMPHAPRLLANVLIEQNCPQWILGNDLLVTPGALPRSKFLAQYPSLARAVKIAEDLTKNEKNEADKGDNGSFTVARRTRRPKKGVYVEPILDYDLDKAPFAKVTIARISSEVDASWGNSFSDLALNRLLPKHLADDSRNPRDRQ